MGRIYCILDHLRVVSDAGLRLYLLRSRIFLDSKGVVVCRDLRRVCYFCTVGKLDLLYLDGFTHVWRRFSQPTAPLEGISSAVAYDATELALLSLLSLSGSYRSLTKQLSLVNFPLFHRSLLQTFVDTFNLARHLQLI